MASRLSPLTEDQLDDEQRTMWTTITGQARAIPAVNESGNLVGPYDVLLRRPRTGVLLAGLGNGLRHGTQLDPRVLELGALAVAEHWRCGFEWVVHSQVAHRLGVAQEAISAIQAGHAPELADEPDELAYRWVAQLLRTGSVDDDTFDQARGAFGESGIVDLTVFAGNFTVISFILNGFLVASSEPAPSFGRGTAQPHDLQVPRRDDSLVRRLPALGEDELTQEQRVLWDAIHATPRPLPPVDDQGHLLGPYDVLLRSPGTGKLLGTFGTSLRANTDVPKRLQELVVLVAIAHWRCEMLWAAHEPQARTAGVGDEIIAAIRDGARPGFDAADADLAVLYQLASELFRTGHVAEATFDKSRQLLGDAGLIDLVLLAGHYCTQSFLLNAGQVPPLGGASAAWPK